MYYKKKKNNLLKNFKYFKILLILVFFLVSFILGAYAQKTHLFYTFIKPFIFQNVSFFKKKLQGKFQNVDKIYLNIDFETLNELNNRRQDFIKNELIDPDLNSWLSISINYKNNKYESKIRFKGRMTETHLNPTMRSENISYKIKIKKKEKGNILGMREFSLMDLRRRGYLLEWYARTFLKSEGLIYLDYKFVNLFINGKNHGIYAMDESISEATLTRNKRRDSVSVRIDNNFNTGNIDLSLTNPSGYAAFNNDYVTGNIDLLNEEIGDEYKELKNLEYFNQNYPISLKNKIIINPSSKRLKNFNIAFNLLDNFRNGSLKTEEVFDIDQLAKGFAASDILDGWHGINWTNLSFYLNPISLKLEPIFQDWYNEGSVSTGNEKVQRNIRYLDVYNYGIFYRNIFASEKFIGKYVFYLEKYTEDKFLENFNKKIHNRFKVNLKTIYKSSPYYEFPSELFNRKTKTIKNFLYHNDPLFLNLFSQSKDINGYNNTLLEVGNKHVLPIYVSKVILKSFDGKILEKSLDVKLKPRNLKKFTELKFDGAPVKYDLIGFKSPDFKNFKSISLEYNIIGSKKKFIKIISHPVESIERKKINLNNYLITNKDTSILINNNFIEKIDNEYIMQKGTWIITSDLIIPDGKKLIIPPGNEIILANNAQILSKSAIIAKGTPQNKISIKSYSPSFTIGKKNRNLTYKIKKKLNGISVEHLSDKSKPEIKIKPPYPGQCIIIFEAKEISIFENVDFDNLRNCEQGPIHSEGAFNVYKSKIKMKNINFNNNKFGDDGINFINSEFNLENIHLKNIYADGLDLDFSYGKIKNFSCYECANDGIDISNTTLQLENYKATKIKDKALSIGENSIFNAKNIEIIDSNIGVAIKDGSIAKIDKIKIKLSKYPVTTYIKKREFGPAVLEINNLNLEENLNPILIEEGSKLKIDLENLNTIYKKNLFKILYPNAEYKNIQ